MRLILCASALLAVSSVAQDSGRIPQSPFQSKQAYKEFVEQSTGQWVARWNPATGTPRAIYGTGLPIDGWRENSLEEARRHGSAGDGGPGGVRARLPDLPPVRHRAVPGAGEGGGLSGGDGGACAGSR